MLQFHFRPSPKTSPGVPRGRLRACVAALFRLARPLTAKLEMRATGSAAGQALRSSTSFNLTNATPFAYCTPNEAV